MLILGVFVEDFVESVHYFGLLFLQPMFGKKRKSIVVRGHTTMSSSKEGAIHWVG
jgi:hypothetical protein